MDKCHREGLSNKSSTANSEAHRRLYCFSAGVNESVTSFLRAIHSHNSCRNDTCIRHEVRREFLENALDLATISLGDGSSDSVAGHLAHGEMHTLLDQGIHAL